MKVVTRFCFLAVSTFLLLAPSTAMAGSGRITGKVLGKGGEGLLGAVITVFKQDDKGGTISFTRTDKQGSYNLSNLSPGAYQLQVSREGYQPLTSSPVKIESGKTTTINVILQEFIDLMSGPPDPRNWDLRTVVRSTSDRRLIFRYLPDVAGPEVDTEAPFARGGALSVASTTGPGSENYSLFPSNGQNGIASNFAFVEPVSDRGRMILSGQIYTGYDSSWQVRNTYNYRSDPSRDYKITMEYGRVNLSSSSSGDISRPTQLFTEDLTAHESGVQSLGLGFEARNRLMDGLSVDYGFDVSRVYYGTTRNFFSPHFRVTVSPADTWFIRTELASRRFSDNNSLTLPDGDVLNLMDPTYIAQIDGEIRVSQFKHSELAVGKKFPDNTAVEVAVYQDRMQGAGLPFLVGSADGTSLPMRLVQPREDQTGQRGVRVAVNRRILDCLNGSIAYVYGTGTNLAVPGDPLSNEALARSLLDFVQRSYYHMLTGQLQTTFPHTHTTLTAIVRWYPEYSLTPIDLFDDRTDMLAKGVNFSIRQPIPLPEFMGTSGRWEALVDVRNLFDQSHQIVPTSDGELFVTRNPRSLRFGINLNLY